MTNVIALLNKTLAREFYRLNSGFFLLIATLTFGFMSSVEHKALAQFFVSSPQTLLIPVSVWIGYTFKIVNFNRRQLHQDENRMLFNIPFLSFGQQVICTLPSFTLQFLPALCYGIFLIGMAATFGSYEIIIVIILSLFACGTCATVVLIGNLRNPWREKKISFIGQFMDRHFHKPVLQFYIEWLLRKDPLMIAGTKVFSGALIFGVCMLYASEDYDPRLISMAVTASAIANLLILFQLQDFEHTTISWIKNLPVPEMKRYFRFIAVISVLLIPECVVLLRSFPEYLSAYRMGLTILYLLSLCSLLFGLLQTRSWSLESFTRKSFWIFIAFMLLVLFDLPVMALALVNFAAGYLLFSRYYYVFEAYRGSHPGVNKPRL